MVRTEVAGGIAVSAKSLASDFHRAWRRLGAVRRCRQSGEYERLLAGSADRFELERRERAWNRWQSSDGSLLGW